MGALDEQQQLPVQLLCLCCSCCCPDSYLADLGRQTAAGYAVALPTADRSGCLEAEQLAATA